MRFNLVNNHLILNVFGSNYLIDTGCPFSFNYTRNDIIVIDKNNFSISKGFPALLNNYPQSTVSNLVGINIDGFIGMDILERCGLTIDYLNKELTLDVKNGNLCYNLVKWGSIYITRDCVINGHQLPCTVIDTGAYISYIDRRYANTEDKTNKEYKDWNYILGNLSGNLYKVSFDKTISNNSPYHHISEVGLLNSPGFDAAINPYEIIRDELELAPNQTVSFDFINKKVYIL